MRRFVVSVETEFSTNNTLILWYYLKIARQAARANIAAFNCYYQLMVTNSFRLVINEL